MEKLANLILWARAILGAFRGNGRPPTLPTNNLRSNRVHDRIEIHNDLTCMLTSVPEFQETGPVLPF